MSGPVVPNVGCRGKEAGSSTWSRRQSAASGFFAPTHRDLVAPNLGGIGSRVCFVNTHANRGLAPGRSVWGGRAATIERCDRMYLSSADRPQEPNRANVCKYQQQENTVSAIGTGL